MEKYIKPEIKVCVITESCALMTTSGFGNDNASVNVIDDIIDGDTYTIGAKRNSQSIIWDDEE